MREAVPFVVMLHVLMLMQQKRFSGFVSLQLTTMCLSQMMF